MDLNNNSFLSKKDVIRLTTLSDTTIWRLEKRGEFPKRKRFGKNRVFWISKDIHEWLNQQAL